MAHESDFRLSYDYRAGLDDNLPWHNPQNGSVDPNIPGPEAVSDLSFKLGMQVSGADIAMFANNATNAHPKLARGHSTASTPLYTNATVRPRTIGVTATYRF